jgi:glycosyltransferase involved in cell wall biosynthesis
VIFAGHVDRQLMYRYYSAADLFAFPGIGESLGMVFLEAQSCGLPVVALNTGGVPQVVRHGETALLVAQDDGHAMATAIESLLNQKETRIQMASRGIEFIRKERNLHRNYTILSHKLEELVSRKAGLP